MLKMGKADITRGKRKKGILDEATFREDKKTLEWIKTQPTWAKDIAYYEESLPKETKSEKKK